MEEIQDSILRQAQDKIQKRLVDTEEAARILGVTPRAIRFQSTRPCGARPAGGHGKEKGSGVSIHAPTRGATKEYHDVWTLERVSIHAPTRGATSDGALLFDDEG